ncbi:uncharacterized protein LOC108033463 [Drosophila biarmipes]|uniref:uncharacterized protein LOC108033463 n=1 Tax=Drosophila biarmipes TaxID=125945 RepID=UPI0007E612B2|nr:uncharacterized protein LOC108033463 [Drosophila biarmipes]
MYNNNKYRMHLEDHFYGSKNQSPLNEKKEDGHAHKDVECRLRRERINSPEICRKPYSSEKYLGRQDKYRDYKKCACENPHCSYEQRPQRLNHDPLCSKYYHGNHRHKYDEKSQDSQPHQLPYQQNARQQWSPNRVDQRSPRYSPKPYNSRSPFGYSTRKQEPFHEKGGGDCLIYKNLAFGAHPSSKSEDGGGDRGVREHSPQCKSQHQKGESHNSIEAAKAHCQAIGDRFRRQFAPSSESSSSRDSKSKPSKVTVISAKSGDDLRAAVRSQIELQEALDGFKLEVRDKQEESGSDGETSAKPKKIQAPKSEPLIEEAVAIAVEPLSDRALSDDLQLQDLTVSSEDLVSTKVIEPVIWRIQHLYLNTLKEEMKLIEYLGTVPKLVNDVYKRETPENEQKKN